jgi:hypothetical protein
MFLPLTASLFSFILYHLGIKVADRCVAETFLLLLHPFIRVVAGL